MLGVAEFTPLALLSILMIIERKVKTIYANIIADTKPNNTVIKYFLSQNDPKICFLFVFLNKVDISNCVNRIANSQKRPLPEH